ncbi:hypothetical protein ACHAP5_009131 [Fusarium lateritium]
MTLPPLPGVNSPYMEFTQDPFSELEIEDGENDCDNYSSSCPMTMTDHNGSTLYETERHDLLWTIVHENDAETLERYLNTAPWALLSIWDIAYEDASLYGVCNYYLLAAVRRNLHVLHMLLDRSMEPTDPTAQIRFKSRGVEMMNDAARWGCLQTVEFLLDNQPFGTSIHDQDCLGFTALAAAADIYETRNWDPCPMDEEPCPENNEAVMHLLLDRGARATDNVLPPNNRQ